jgi:hypothetical protein
MKKYWREHYNREADFLQCIPLRIIVEWDIEENYMRRPGIGNDRAKLLLREEFPAYLELTYDPENLKRLEAFNILGPSPCCPGNVDASLLQVNASMLACYSGGSNCRMFTTSDPLQFQVIPPSDNFFSFTWRQDIKSRSGGFGSSLINFQREALPRSMNTRRGIGGILHEDNFRIKVSGEDAFGWDEIQTGLKEGELFRVFPIDIKSPTLTNDFYSQQGKDGKKTPPSHPSNTKTHQERTKKSRWWWTTDGSLKGNSLSEKENKRDIIKRDASHRLN